MERWITEWARDSDIQPGRLRRRIGLIAFASSRKHPHPWNLKLSPLSDSDAFVNERAHDLADLLLLDDFGVIDHRFTKRACITVFDLRSMHSWPARVEVRRDWPLLWQKIVDDDSFPIIDVFDAASRVQELITRIDAAHE